MKKWLLVLLLIIVGCSIAPYLFIPSVISLSEIEKVNANSEEAFRHFTDNTLRNKWTAPLNGSSTTKNFYTADSFFVFESDSFNVTGIGATSANIEIGNATKKVNSEVLIVPAGTDSTIIIWEAEIKAGVNPISRVSNYLRAKKIKSQFSKILHAFNSFVSAPENVYSFKIETAKVKDTILIASRKIFSSRPNTGAIYSMVNNLRQYAELNGAKITNAPMLNITVFDSSHYQCTVALPVDKELKNTGDMYLSKMVPGKILVETVNGGPATIDYAYSRLKDYFRQHKHVSPALSFESLVTDRSKETDTTKWVTKIFYPIF